MPRCRDEALGVQQRTAQRETPTGEPRPRFHSDSRSPLPETNDFSGFSELLNGTDFIAPTPRNHCLHNTSTEGPVLNG
jgi:hypothetical protein